MQLIETRLIAPFLYPQECVIPHREPEVTRHKRQMASVDTLAWMEANPTASTAAQMANEFDVTYAAAYLCLRTLVYNGHVKKLRTRDSKGKFITTYELIKH